VSEYQYYEFAAVDRPLTTREQAEQRSLSTRADITATSFVNTYRWGNFKGDPSKLMERYFDAHLYLTNWHPRGHAAAADARARPRGPQEPPGSRTESSGSRPGETENRCFGLGQAEADRKAAGHEAVNPRTAGGTHVTPTVRTRQA
jgi:hypothetical protein